LDEAIGALHSEAIRERRKLGVRARRQGLQGGRIEAKIQSRDLDVPQGAQLRAQFDESLETEGLSPGDLEQPRGIGRKAGIERRRELDEIQERHGVIDAEFSEGADLG
jgi:hypothetical protein